MSQFDCKISYCAPRRKTVETKTVTARLLFPTTISRPLQEAGYTRAIVTITDDGFLVKPYKGPENDVALPDWGDE